MSHVPHLDLPPIARLSTETSDGRCYYCNRRAHVTVLTHEADGKHQSEPILVSDTAGQLVMAMGVNHAERLTSDLRRAIQLVASQDELNATHGDA